jgi:predicted PhzF superfamily epimerase YddE/YHI9
MTLPMDMVDACADRAFSGNPAAVCRLPAPAGPVADATAP